MSVLDYLGSLLIAGVDGLVNYLSAHVLMCLVPAFFIAGALSALFTKESVTKYLGKDTPAYISYPIASVAGLLIAVCSCTILPLFAGIWKKGAGLGPAVTFLFTGPAINLLAITYTGSLIGWDIAFARAVLAIAFGITIGILMMLIFERAGLVFRGRTAPRADDAFTKGTPATAIPEVTAQETSVLSRLLRHKSSVLFVLLVSILVVGTAPIPLSLRVAGLVLTVAVSVAWAWRTNTRTENKSWMNETYFFAKMILPLLLIGVFVAGVASALIPEEVVGEYLGSNSLSAVLIAVLFGVFMYFPTLVEVPVARMFLDLGMAKGPLLAYLLADPELSFQSVLVTGRIMGKKKIAVYVLLVVVFTTAAGMIFGLFAG
jgi:uncharacterized membrane protein YraQ (UPF0718 family)